MSNSKNAKASLKDMACRYDRESLTPNADVASGYHYLNEVSVYHSLLWFYLSRNIAELSDTYLAYKKRHSIVVCPQHLSFFIVGPTSISVVCGVSPQTSFVADARLFSSHRGCLRIS